MTSTTVGTSSMQERLRRAEILPAIALRPAQDAAQDVAAILVARHRAVGQGERQGADMIRDDAIRGVLEIVQFAGVRRRAGHASESPSKIGVNTSVS